MACSLMLGLGGAKGKGAVKAIGGVRGKAPLLDLVALAPRFPAVAKPKVDAKRKAAPKEVAATPEGKAKVGAKTKAVGDVGVAPVLPVACCLIGGGPVLPPPLEPAGWLPQQFHVPRVVRAAPNHILLIAVILCPDNFSHN